MWVAVGNGSGNTNNLGNGCIQTSTDGLTWQNASVSGTFLAGTCYSVKWNGSTWITGGNDTIGNSSILTSNNGTDWSISATNVAFNVNDFAWNGRMWVAGCEPRGNSSPIVTSTDGITWNNTAGIDQHYIVFGVAWNGKMFVAVGENTSNNNQSTILVSYDGQTWRAPNGSGTKAFVQRGMKVTWTGSVWVAVGTDVTSSNPNPTPNNTILISQDGETWSSTQSGFNNNIRGNGVASTNVWAGPTGPTDLQSTIEKLKYAVFFQKGTYI
jgi:hypothetical protein